MNKVWSELQVFSDEGRLQDDISRHTCAPLLSRGPVNVVWAAGLRHQGSCLLGFK